MLWSRLPNVPRESASTKTFCAAQSFLRDLVAAHRNTAHTPLMEKRADDGDMVMVHHHRRRDHRSSAAWDNRVEVVVHVVDAVAAGHAAMDTRGIVPVVRAAHIPNAAKDTVPVVDRTKFREEDTVDIDHHCEHSREDSALDHMPIPSCQSYYVLPQRLVESIALVPKNRIDCRTPMDTSPVVLDRTLLEFRTEDIPRLRRSLRDARRLAAALGVVRSGPFQWV
jgi:hypothetical protein